MASGPHPTITIYVSIQAKELWTRLIIIDIDETGKKNETINRTFYCFWKERINGTFIAPKT